MILAIVACHIFCSFLQIVVVGFIVVDIVVGNVVASHINRLINGRLIVLLMKGFSTHTQNVDLL